MAWVPLLRALRPAAQSAPGGNGCRLRLKSPRLFAPACCIVACPFAAASVGDVVWRDSNANGVQDPGEVGFPGVVVILLDANGTQVANTTTGHPDAGTPEGRGKGILSGLQSVATGSLFSPFRAVFADP